jgi:hypothetical protein
MDDVGRDFAVADLFEECFFRHVAGVWDVEIHSFAGRYQSRKSIHDKTSNVL